MSGKEEQDEESSRPARGWDYSRHPLGAGGAQLVTVVIGVAATLLLMGVILVLLLLLQPVPSR